MKINDFLERLKEVLEIDGMDLTETTELNTMAEFDSLSVMSIIAMVDEYFGKRLNAEQLRSITTVRSLMEMIGMNNFE